MALRRGRAEALPGTSTVDVNNRTARDLGFSRSFWFNELRAGRAFGGSALVAAVASEAGHVQLFNPAASGITVIVFGMWGHAAAASTIFHAFHNTDLVTDAPDRRNLLNGGAAPAAVLRAVTPVSAVGDIFNRLADNANTPTGIFDGWVCELGEGEGALIRGDDNITMSGNFRWIEI